MLGNPAGRTVYSNGSFAPTKGQVSGAGSQGYVRRNLAQRAKQNNLGRLNQRFNGAEGFRQGAMRIGNDGQSDTRSGLARAALTRQGGPVGQPPTTGGIPGGGFGNGGGLNPNQPGGSTPPIIKRPEGGGAGGGTFPTTGGGTPTPPGGVQVPAVTINNNGQMELPYDANYNSQVYQDLNDFNNQLMQLQIGSQQQAAQYQMGMRNENQQYGQQQIADLAGNAGSGTAFSSRYATDVGKTAGGHQNNINDLTSGDSQYRSQVDAQKAAIQDQFNQELQHAAAERAANAAANAGSLGYGNASGGQNGTKSGGTGGTKSPGGGTGGGTGGGKPPKKPTKPGGGGGTQHPRPPIKHTPPKTPRKPTHNVTKPGPRKGNKR